MLMVNGMEITKQQLDGIKVALVEANHEMEAAMRCGNQAKAIFPACSKEIVGQENIKQMEMTKVGGEL